MSTKELMAADEAGALAEQLSESQRSPLAAILADPERLQAIPIETVERLLELNRRDQEDHARRAFNAALSGFQAACPQVTQDGSGAHGARYATLDHIMRTIRPCLTDHGLSVSFDSCELEDGRLSIICIVHHRLGHFARAQFTVSREARSNRMNDTQRDGSAMSYGQRYALRLALGISAGAQDDDGESSYAKPVTAQQAADLGALIDEVQASRADFLKWAGVDALEKVPASRYREAVRLLERKRK